MINFIIFSILLLLLYLVSIRNNSINFMDKQCTKNLKGLAIMTIVWAHVGSALSIKYIQFIAGVGVCLFLICSGYGCEESYFKNGLNKFWLKKILKVYVPFCIVEFLGMIIFYSFDVKNYILDILFLKNITSYSWYMFYIIICYAIFYVWKKIFAKQNISSKKSFMFLLGMFIIWFIVDSLFFSNPNMPFLRARQMLAFPLGILLSMKKNDIVEKLLKNKIKNYILIVILIIIGIGFMGITQFSYVKNSKYIIQNILSLFTVFPLAISIIMIIFYKPKIIKSKFLNFLGKYSYEIYIIHAFTLKVITNKVVSLTFFIFITLVSAIIFNNIMERMKNKWLI